MFPVHFFSLSTISWIAFLAPFLLLYASLTFTFSRFTSLLQYSGSGFSFRILCGTKRSIPSKTTSLKFFHMSSTQLPLFAHVDNLSRRKFCRTYTFVFWYTSTSCFSWVTNLFSTHSTSTKPRNGHWPLVPYRKIWVHFRVVRGKRPVKNPLGSVFQPPECTHCPSTICA